MLFNSTSFAAFFAVVFCTCFLLRSSYRYQNIFLLFASYVFYGFWDWRFSSLLLVSTTVDFFVGWGISAASSPVRKRWLMVASVVCNLSILGFFKYFNFFADSFASLLAVFNVPASYPTLNLVLPLGISFYTFQSMSYTIDIYRSQLQPTKNFVSFALYVSFFPQLVAGPIERAANLLPQIETSRKVDAAKIDVGVFLCLWGLFKKVVIADNLARIADRTFAANSTMQGIDVMVGVLAFAGQIYCDFSGYSDMARGLARLLGFELMLNFRLPYFAKNPRDFWNRWHISLSTWLKDYLYIPLGGSKGAKWRTYCNVMITMLLGGLWHGASWNFVIWGAFHGIMIVFYRAFLMRPEPPTPWRKAGIIQPLGVLTMFVLTLVGWVIFRSESVEQVVAILGSCLRLGSRVNWNKAYDLAFFIFPLLCMQIWQGLSKDLLVAAKLQPILKGVFYAVLIFGIAVFGVRDSMEFIYFQF